MYTLTQRMCFLIPCHSYSFFFFSISFIFTESVSLAPSITPLLNLTVRDYIFFPFAVCFSTFVYYMWQPNNKLRTKSYQLDIVCRAASICSLINPSTNCHLSIPFPVSPSRILIASLSPKLACLWGSSHVMRDR